MVVLVVTVPEPLPRAMLNVIEPASARPACRSAGPPGGDGGCAFPKPGGVAPRPIETTRTSRGERVPALWRPAGRAWVVLAVLAGNAGAQAPGAPPPLRIVTGVTPGGDATGQWLAMIRKRLPDRSHQAVAGLRRPLTLAERGWAEPSERRLPRHCTHVRGLPSIGIQRDAKPESRLCWISHDMRQLPSRFRFPVAGSDVQSRLRLSAPRRPRGAVVRNLSS